MNESIRKVMTAETRIRNERMDSIGRHHNGKATAAGRIKRAARRAYEERAERERLDRELNAIL